jgi:hypothetical protein
MKLKHLTLILFLAIILMPMFGPALAQSNHTLEWGVDSGEEFTYALQREYYGDSSSRVFIESQLPFLAYMEEGQKVLLEVEYLETIENLINESSQLPHSYCNLLRNNDSALFYSSLTGFVIPIGDWNFLAEVENITGTAGLTLIDNEDEWGTIGTGIMVNPGAVDITVRVEMRYEKENGTLSYLRHRYSALGNDIVDIIFVRWHLGMPTVVGGDIQATTLLIIAISGGMGLFIAFIVYRGIKRKKSVMQRLGE